ncbi:MAG: peptidoglycan editing factor PgeF [Agarilytica sp.]
MPETAEQSSGAILPDWPAPSNIHSLITTRYGGVSDRPYKSFNLAAHVGDDPSAVKKNRRVLADKISAETHWFNQVHGIEVARLSSAAKLSVSEADAVYTSEVMQVCAVLTADCLPLLMASKNGDEVAAVHCGWKGLVAGMLPAAINAFQCSPGDILVYLGPAISQPHFEVGNEVLEAFLGAQKQRVYGENVRASFTPSSGEHLKYHADLYRIARSELSGIGVHNIYGGGFCTFSDPRFYSYRRDLETGRMASLVWIGA